MKSLKVLTLLLFFTLNVSFYFMSSCSRKVKCNRVSFVNIEPYNNQDSLPRPIDAGGVLGKALYFEVKYVDSFIKCAALNRSPWSNSLYASSTQYFSELFITKINVTCDRSYDTSHPAGSLLDDLFIVQRNVKANINDTNKTVMYLRHSPNDTGQYRFTFRLKSSDSAKQPDIIVNLDPIKLLN